MLIVARLWTRLLALENRLFRHCNHVHQEELGHALCECSSNVHHVRTHFLWQLTGILLLDEKVKHSAPALDSVAFALKLLGAPIEPIYDASADHMFLRIAFSFIVNCVLYNLHERHLSRAATSDDRQQSFIIVVYIYIIMSFQNPLHRGNIIELN